MTDEDFLCRAAAYTKDGLRRFGYVTEGDLGLRVLRDAVVTARRYGPGNTFTGAVHDRSGRLVASSQRFNERDIVPDDPERLDGAALRDAGECRRPFAIYGGILFPILGHFLFESIARLWMLPEIVLRGQGADRPCVVFHPWPGLDRAVLFANPLYAAMLAALGVRAEDIVLADRSLGVDTLVLPDPASRYHLDLNTRMAALADFLTARIAAPRPSVAPFGLYLSRSLWPENRRIRNEAEIDAWAASRGLCVVHPQAMDPPALLRLLADAQTVVASDGSHAHLALFCRPDTRVVLLDTRPVPTQFAIARLRGFRALHLPLFEAAWFCGDHGLVDVRRLAPLLDAALERQAA